jgi:flagellar biosynthetic protein FliR
MNFQLLFLVFVRVIAMIEVAPLLSSEAIPQEAKIGLGLFVSAMALPYVVDIGYRLPSDTVQYFLLIVGEALIGIIIGFMLVMIFAVFQMAGEFFSLQMGFGASEVFDPLAQIEIPLMGQFFNIAAMFVFLSMGGFYKFMLVGVYRSFASVRAADLVGGREVLLDLMGGGLGQLFASALTVALPILGTLLLVSVAMGLLAKAAPQMNVLVMGFPVAIAVAFLLLLSTLPYLLDAFGGLIDATFEKMQRLFADLRSEVAR